MSDGVKRSELRLRERPHINPARAGETIVEVVRDGEVVATIYGTMDGIHVVSERFRQRASNAPSLAELGPVPSIIVPLLAPGESCPICGDTKRLNPVADMPCPVCSEPQTA